MNILMHAISWQRSIRLSAIPYRLHRLAQDASVLSLLSVPVWCFVLFGSLYFSPLSIRLTGRRVGRKALFLYLLWKLLVDRRTSARAGLRLSFSCKWVMDKPAVQDVQSLH